MLLATPLAVWSQAPLTDEQRFEAARKKLEERQKAAAAAAATRPAVAPGAKPATAATASDVPRLEVAIQQLHKSAMATFTDAKFRGVAENRTDPLVIKQLNDMGAALHGKVFEYSFDVTGSETIKDWGHNHVFDRRGLREMLQKLAKSPIVIKGAIPLEVPQQAQAALRTRYNEIDQKKTAELREQEAESRKGTAAHRKYHGEEAKKAKASRDAALEKFRKQFDDAALHATVMLSTDDPELLAMKTGVPKMVTLEVVKIVFEPWGALDPERQDAKDWSNSGKIWVFVRPPSKGKPDDKSAKPAAAAPAKPVAQGVVFAVDASAGMATHHRAVVTQVLTAIRQLPAGAPFNIVATRDGKASSFDPQMSSASPENIARAQLFLESLTPLGAENYPAMFAPIASMRPATVWLCTDGDLDDAFATQAKVVELARKGAYRINTVSNWIPAGAQHKALITLASISEGSGGVCLNNGKALKLADMSSFDAAKPNAVGTSVLQE